MLYGSPEFEPEVIMPAGIASVVSYCVFGMYTGWEPLFATPNLTFDNPWRLGPYLLLMFFMIVLAALYTHTFYGMVRLFHRLPGPPHFRPAIGAFLTGLVALASVLRPGPPGNGPRRTGLRLRFGAAGHYGRAGRHDRASPGHFAG